MVVERGCHDVVLPVTGFLHVFSALEVVVVRHVEDVADLVSDGEGGRQTRVFADGATARGIAHRPQFRQPQRVAFTDGSADILPSD